MSKAGLQKIARILEADGPEVDLREPTAEELAELRSHLEREGKPFS